MYSISQEIALKFCELCNWTYESWITHKHLFDKNDKKKETIGRAIYFTHRLSIITQEYCLLQIAKLHDPAIQNGFVNLTIEYMVKYGDWGIEKGTIESIQEKLSKLWLEIKHARNKVLSHNDLETIISDEAIGSFGESADDEYFEYLQEFVNAVHNRWFGTPYFFNDLAKVDVKEFLLLLENPNK